jgi:hypothetical protein
VRPTRSGRGPRPSRHDLVEQSRDETRRRLQRLGEGIERRGRRRDVLAVAAQSPERIDGRRDEIGEVVQIETGQVASPVGGAERPERPAIVLARGQTRPLGQEPSGRDPRCQRRVAPLQKADHRIDRVQIGVGLEQDRLDRLGPCAGPRPDRLENAIQTRAREDGERGFDAEVRLLGVVPPRPKKAGEVRRGRIRRVELGQRRREEQNPHGRRLYQADRDKRKGRDDVSSLPS